MTVGEPSLDALEGLAASPDVRDRAFVASSVAMRLHAEERGRLEAIYARVRETADREHAEVRARIRERRLDREAFLASLRGAPIEARDHLVEEILGVAYPPLERAPEREVIGHVPSGVSEILFMLEHAELEAGKTFVDLGSGLGKVVLSTALLTDARAIGVESNPELVTRARAAAAELGLDRAVFVEGDLHEVAIPSADVYYMFVPSTRSGEIAERLASVARERRILLFSEPLDLERFPWLRACNASSYWLEKYEAVATTCI